MRISCIFMQNACINSRRGGKGRSFPRGEAGERSKNLCMHTNLMQSKNERFEQKICILHTEIDIYTTTINIAYKIRRKHLKE